jgi:putative CRISPR-associated protein (TIGR02620 family)
MKTIIVTRHTGMVEWLKTKGITGEVLAHVTEMEVAGAQVVGALPLHLASKAEYVIAVDLPNLRSEQRGHDLTPAEMDAAGATLRKYKVLDMGSMDDPMLNRAEILAAWSAAKMESHGYPYKESSLNDWADRYLRRFIESEPHTLSETAREWAAYEKMSEVAIQRNEARFAAWYEREREKQYAREAYQNRGDGEPLPWGRDRD